MSANSLSAIYKIGNNARWWILKISNRISRPVFRRLWMFAPLPSSWSKCSLISPPRGQNHFSGQQFKAPVPFNSPLTSIKPPRCGISPNGGVTLPQLSRHILQNVNERVCKIKFMGCRRRMRTRRAITYPLSSGRL